MRALPGGFRPGSSGRGYGSGGYRGGGDGLVPQPRVGLLFAAVVPLLLAGGWLADRLSAVWCDIAGCTPTTYLADMLHVLLLAAVTLCALILATVLAVVGRRRGWWSYLAWRGAYGLAWLLSRPVQAWRRHRARPVVPARPVTVTASVSTPQVGAERPADVVDVELLLDGVWTPAESVTRRVR